LGSTMSFLRGGANQAASVPLYTGLQIQTSSGAVPITISYGVQKIAPNCIWQGGFYYTKNGGGKSGGGGKGGSGSSTSYNYYDEVILGLCEGPITGGDCAVWTGTSISDLYYAGYFSLIVGDTPQGIWQPSFGGNELSYPGLAFVATWQINLGSSATLPYLSFEIKGRLYGTGANGIDADPAQVISDFLTNAQYGVGFPGGSIDATTLFGSSGDSSYQSYCAATGLCLSPVVSDQESASSVLNRWLQLTNTAAIWSDGLLKFIPYGDTSVTGTLYQKGSGWISFALSGNNTYYSYAASPKVASGTCTFNPDLTPVYNLTDDDYIYTDSEDPVQVSRVDPYSAYNMQRLEICQRSNYYDATPITVFDQNAIELYGLRIAATLTAHEICDAGVAQTAAQLILQRGLYIRNQYTFKLSWEYCLLEPMDLVTLTDANLGLENVAVRITEVEEDAAGILTVTAEEFPGGTATAVAYAVQTKSSSGIGSNGSAGIVNTPLIFEPPTALTGGATQIWLGASGGLPPVEKLEEASSTGVHQCTMTLAAAQAAGTEVNFSLYVQADERSALLLGIFDGAVTRACAFDLAAQTATPGDNAVTASISVVSKWFAVSMTVAMAARAIPILTIGLQTPFGTSAYSGVSGDGLYLWGAAFAAGAEAASTLPAFQSVTGATLAQTSLTTPAGAAGSVNPNWGGCNVWASLDDVSYTQIGQITEPAKQGLLTAALSAFAGANPDTGDTLSVNLAQSDGALSGTSPTGLQNALTLSRVVDELLAFETATLTAANAYNLTTLGRGLYGTTAGAHEVGASFTQLDGAILKYDLPTSYIGQTIYVKFQSFNIFGQGVQDLSTCAAYSYAPSGSGLANPIGAQLASGLALDLGEVADVPAIDDDFGGFSGAVSGALDLGAI
jgi:hypothetical protein